MQPNTHGRNSPARRRGWPDTTTRHTAHAGTSARPDPPGKARGTRRVTSNYVLRRLPTVVRSWSRRRISGLLLLGGLVVLLLWPYPAERLEHEGARSLRVVDRNGQLLHEARSDAGDYGRWVSLSEISPYLVLATLASEDARFRQHIGIDPVGIARALWLNLRERRLGYGGSTLTQQLAKALHPERRPRGAWTKLTEARDALRLELRLSKDEILEQYLNRVYYGRAAAGAEAAARRFFDKSASNLTLEEAALLAVLPRAPSRYAPDRFAKRATDRRAHVLGLLVARGWVESDVARSAARAPLRLAPLPTPRLRHALDALPPSELRAATGSLSTTLDLALSDRLQTRLREHLFDLRQRGAEQAAVVVIDNRSGDVLALIGSRDYDDSDAHGAVNAALAPRPPGSTLKPFVYGLALERGRNPSSPAFDVPTSWRDFQPRNANLEHLGLVDLRVALGSSLNVPAVRLAAEIGIPALAQRLVDLKLAADPVALTNQGLALALGSFPVRLLDLTNAYATLARGGAYRPFRLTHPELPPPATTQLIAPIAAYQVSQVLADAHARRRQFDLETPLEFDFPVAVKTGTSKSFCDNWAVGYTPELSVGVWVGNFDGRPMERLLAMQGAAPLFRDVMLTALQGRSRTDFTPPAGVDTVAVCPLSGLAHGAHCPPARHELVAAEQPPAACTWHGADGGLHLPAELLAQRTHGGATPLRTDDSTLKIVQPSNESRIAIDGLIPRSRQKLTLKALVREPRVTRVRWELDGAVLSEVGAPFASSWILSPGKHRLRAVALAPLRGGELELEIVAVDAVELEVLGMNRGLP